MYFLLACSGPHALATIRRNVLFSLSQAVILGLLCWASLSLWRHSGRRRWLLPALCLALLVLHPTWIDGGGSGDCGYGMVRMAIGYNVVAVIIVVSQGMSLARSRRARSKFWGPVDNIDA